MPALIYVCIDIAWNCQQTSGCYKYLVYFIIKLKNYILNYYCNTLDDFWRNPFHLLIHFSILYIFCLLWNVLDFILDNKDRDTLSPWKPWLINGLTFPHHVLRVFYSNLGIVMDTESLEEMYKSLSILQAGKQSQEEIHQVILE